MKDEMHTMECLPYELVLYAGLRERFLCGFGVD